MRTSLNLSSLVPDTIADRPRCAPQKGVPSIITKKEKKQSKEQQALEFRTSVWKRDKGKSRASGKKLSKRALDWDLRGEVHHALKRSTNPDRIYDITVGILLSKTEHKLAETRCPNAPEHHMLEISGPDDLGQPQTFTARDVHGKITKTRIV